jgi:hypothetical protein
LLRVGIGLFGSQLVLTDRQRNGGAEDVVGIVLPLGLDEPLNIAAIAFCCAFRISAGKKVRVSARERDGAKGLKRAAVVIDMAGPSNSSMVYSLNIMSGDEQL